MLPKTFAQTIAEEQAKTRKQARSATSQPRLQNASLDDTGIQILDREGKLKGTVGKQSDGSHGVTVSDSPAQPTPTAPVVTEGAAGTAEVSWDGSTTDGPVPLVHGHTEVLTAFSESGVEPALAAYHLASTIRDRKGGSTVINCPTPGTWFVRLRIVGQDRETRGAHSAASTFTVGKLVDTADIEARLNAFADGELPDGAYESLMARLGEFVVVRAGQIETNALDSMTITSPLIQSHPGNIGWKHKPNGSSAWYDLTTGTMNTEVGTDGKLFAQGLDATGNVLSGNANRYASLRDADAQFGFPRLQLRAAAGLDPAYLGMGDPGDSTAGGLTVLGSSRVPGNNRTRLLLGQNGRFELGEAGSFAGVSGTSTLTTVTGINDVMVENRSDRGRIRIRTNSGGTGVDSLTTGRDETNGLYVTLYTRTTSNSANMFVDPTFNIVYRTTSLESSKVDINRSPEIDLEAVKQLMPTTFRDRGSVERGEHAPTQIGLIAEDVKALGLDCITTEDGPGILSGVAYDRVPELLILWNRDLEARVGDLETENAALKERLDAFEARLNALEGN